MERCLWNYNSCDIYWWSLSMTVNLLVNFFTLVNLSSSSIHCFLTLIIDHYCSLCWTVTDLYREGKARHSWQSKQQKTSIHPVPEHKWLTRGQKVLSKITVWQTDGLARVSYRAKTDLTNWTWNQMRPSLAQSDNLISISVSVSVYFWPRKNPKLKISTHLGSGVLWSGN